MTIQTLSRRAMLRGAGVTLALPLLEAMQPARVLGAGPAAKPPRRLVFIYASTGVAVPSWTPEGEGADYQLSPTLLPLQEFKDDLLVLSGLDHRREDRAANEHDMASSTLLSTAADRPARSGDLRHGHHGRSDRREQDRRTDPAAVARAGLRRRFQPHAHQQRLVARARDADGPRVSAAAGVCPDVRRPAGRRLPPQHPGLRAR